MPRKKLYEILDVPEKASSAEIKKAYVKKAKKAHPDAGGSHEDIVAITSAYRVLGNDEARAKYDRTGDDFTSGYIKTDEEKARDEVLHAFSMALQQDSPHILNGAKSVINGKLSDIVIQKAKTMEYLKQIRSKRDKISTKRNKPNLFHMVLDQEEARLEQMIEYMNEGIKIMKDGLAMLDDYDSCEILMIESGLIYSYKTNPPFNPRGR